jgi:hypothetical protein
MFRKMYYVLLEERDIWFATSGIPQFAARRGLKTGTKERVFSSELAQSAREGLVHLLDRCS